MADERYGRDSLLDISYCSLHFIDLEHDTAFSLIFLQK